MRVNTAQVAGGYPTGDISCPGSSTCYATAAGFVESGGGVRGVPALVPVSSSGVVGPVQTLGTRSGNAYGIACAAEDECTVVGVDNSTAQGFVVVVTAGRSGPVTTWSNSNYFSSVSCVSFGACAVVGSNPAAGVAAWTGSEVS